MTVFWLGLVVIVAVAGFFVGSLVTRKQFKQEELEQEAQNAKNALEQYRQDVADHLANTGKLVSKMKDNYDQLLAHVEETNQLLLTQKEQTPSQPFFSKETTEQLQASLKQRPERRVTRDNPDSQPADYASGESGLFSGHSTKDQQTQGA